MKYKTGPALDNTAASTKSNLHNKMSFVDYVRVVTKLLVPNDQNISKMCIKPR